MSYGSAGAHLPEVSNPSKISNLTWKCVYILPDFQNFADRALRKVKSDTPLYENRHKGRTWHCHGREVLITLRKCKPNSVLTTTSRGRPFLPSLPRMGRIWTNRDSGMSKARTSVTPRAWARTSPCCTILLCVAKYIFSKVASNCLGRLLMETSLWSSRTFCLPESLILKSLLQSTVYIAQFSCQQHLF